jgi:signal transduction histidine kinase
VVAGLGAAEFLVLRPAGWPIGIAVEIAACALLTLRRKNPLVFATLGGVVMLLVAWIGPALDQVSVPILVLTLACFSLARWVRDLRGLFGVAVILLVTFADYLFPDNRAHSVGDVIFVCTLAGTPYVLGRVTRTLFEQKTLLERQQELIKREAARAERDRIARELHDVIAHSVSAMVVQTAAAQDLVSSDPERAQAVLADVAETGRRALAETGRLLHVIRDHDNELGLEPTPGLSQLPELVEQFRENGLSVEVELDEPLPALPAGLDVSAYRIVQEALTNALRYGADRTAAIWVSGTSSELTIRATNPCTGSPSVTGVTGVGSGLGLLGMAERVSLLGGTLTHGVDGQGLFRLAASLPLEAG